MKNKLFLPTKVVYVYNFAILYISIIKLVKLNSTYF